MNGAGTWADGEVIKVKGSKKSRQALNAYTGSSAPQSFMADLEKAVLEQW